MGCYKTYVIYMVEYLHGYSDNYSNQLHVTISNHNGYKLFVGYHTNHKQNTHIIIGKILTDNNE